MAIAPVPSQTRLKPAEDMPGRFGLPFLGEGIGLFKDEELYYWRHFEQYGPVFKTRVLGQKFAFLIGPDANRLVLMEQADRVSTTLGWDFLRPLFGGGLLFLEGDEHRATRRLMYPAFHGRAIASYFETVQNVVRDFVADWAARESISLAAEFRKLTLVVASRLFLGSQTDTEVEKTSDWFLKLFAARLSILRWDLPFTLYGRSQRARRDLISFLQPIIAERQRQGNLEHSRDVLGLLLAATDEEGKHLSEEEVINQTLFLLFAGHETTATLLAWLIFELGNHPQWQARLRSEQAAVVEEAPLTLAHLKQMPQLTNVLKEGERLYPPVYGLPRGVVKDIEYAGYRIPAGWYVDVSPMLTHRMPELFANPNVFDPDRFAPPREEDKKHPFALVGFGSGPHGCLGFEFAQMEMKVVLSTLLSHYEWTVTPIHSEIDPIRQPSRMQNSLRGHFKKL